ncbi:hypothetical protein CO614_05875 [Lysobacteraceae bacterium NML120232]|nr:hypothetical protein CO608_07740 [Xanthomonadaceae bacterium NML08-0793]PJK12056.1 hypothetical protein CO614_05875 [Xanthomonadaceae bacterium NML120232]
MFQKTTSSDNVRFSRLYLALSIGLITAPPAVAQFRDAATEVPLGSALGQQGVQQVDRIQVSVERDGLPADGQTPAKLQIELFNAAGQLVPGETVVTLQASNGRFQLPGANSDEFGLITGDIDSVTPGFQITAKDGRADVWLRAPVEAQQVDVQVISGGSVARGAITFVPELRDMLAVGIVEGIISFDRKVIQPARPDDGFEERINSWSRSSGDGKRHAALRTAFFLKGKVRGDALLTMAYDSDKPDRDRLFRDLDPERWYPVYGDASITGFEARSNSRLYLRLDKDRHYLMYGDIATGDGFSERAGQGSVASTQVRDLGQYNRGLTGVRAHLENDKGYLDAFASDDNLRQVVEEFPGRGLSGPYTVSNSSHAVLGTERVELVVRDRHAPSRIVSVKQLGRFTDYSFEPFSGRILFNQPIPSVDESLNPVSVRITYEVEQGGKNFWVYGVNGQYRLGSHFEVGGGYIKDENPLAPFQLASANATVNLGERTWLRGEYARTRSLASSIGGNIYTLVPQPGADKVEGDAWRAEFGHAGKQFSMLAWYGESDENFNNPASSYLGGRRQGGLDVGWLLGKPTAESTPAWRIFARGVWVEDQRYEAERTQIQAGLGYQPNDRLSLEIGANHVSEHGNGGLGSGLSIPGNLSAPFGVGVVTPGFGGGFYGGSSTALNPYTGQTLYNTGSSWSGGYGSWIGNGLAGVPVEYTALRLGLTYRPVDRFDISAEVEQDLDHKEHRRAAVGAGFRVHEKTRLYGRYEWNTGLSSVATSEGVLDPVTGERRPSPYETNAFVFGLDTEYMEGGTVFSEYRMYDAFSARQAQWASGLRNLWHINENLSLQTGFERLQILDGEGQTATAATVAAEWRPDDLWLVNGRLEWRRTDASGFAGYGLGNNGNNGGIGSIDWLNNGYDSWLSTITVARKLSRDWTILARNYYLLNKYNNDTKDSYENRFQAGFAYRDTDTNRVNVLGKYEYWTRRDVVLPNDQWSPNPGSSLDLSNSYDKHIVSVHTDWHPSRTWWLNARLAGKRQTNYFSDNTQSRHNAYLVGARLTHDITERWDISLMGYQMWSPGSSKQFAAGAEVGYLLTSNLWLSAGYNLRGFRDDDLTAGEYTNQGAYLRLRFKFDENLFGRGKASVNSALPR